MLKIIHTTGLYGIDGFIITVECFIAAGMPSFEIVGLPDAVVKESKERIRAAMKTCGFSLPNRIITINLAPANRKKEGSSLDLALFTSIIANEKELDINFQNMCFIGELSLSGDALWVLVDFFDRIEYHTAGEYPVKIAFFAEGEYYEIIHVPPDREILIYRRIFAPD